jgi:hypothetical protein
VLVGGGGPGKLLEMPKPERCQVALARSLSLSDVMCAAPDYFVSIGFLFLSVRGGTLGDSAKLGRCQLSSLFVMRAAPEFFCSREGGPAAAEF